jgi:hypothetical protein
MEKYNEDAFQDWKEKALEACPNCGRTFLPDRLQVHLRSCKVPVNKEDSKVERPKDLMPSAKVKEASENQPKKERKKPQGIAHLIRAAREASKGGPDTVEPTKSKPMNAAPTDDDRTPCPCCGRKFAPDRLDVHYNICAKKNGGPVKSSGKPKAGFKASYD